jgi:DNA-binding beta-propeller fold protein YncE
VGTGPNSIAVNPVTDRIYVANANATVTVIDGTTNATTSVSVGFGVKAAAIAVNPVTNKIYVADASPVNGQIAATVMVIDGATNATVGVPVGVNPSALAINTVTNTIYAISPSDGAVTVIDGDTNATVTVAVAIAPYGIALNSTTGQVYINSAGGALTVINGASNATTTVPVGNQFGGGRASNSGTIPNNPPPVTVATNPVSNKAYVINGSSDNVTVIGSKATPPTIATQPVPHTINSGSTVVFTVGVGGSVQSSLARPGGPGALVSQGTAYQWQVNGVNLTDGNGISGSTGPQLVIQGATTANDGSYACIVTSGGLSTTSNAANLSVTTSSNPGLATSISTRAFVGTGDNILIGGFFVVGSISRTVLVQGLGPALGQFGVTGFLEHPTLSIHQTQNGSDVTLYSNTGWGSSQVLLNAAAAVFASPTLPANSPDSELLLTLPPGGYSAEVSGADGGSGVALCAIYELP